MILGCANEHCYIYCSTLDLYVGSLGTEAEKYGTWAPKLIFLMLSLNAFKTLFFGKSWCKFRFVSIARTP